MLYINLSHRTDRKHHIEQQLHKIQPLSPNIHRIDAVLETMCGHLGCGKSHVKALEYAISQGWESVLIVEDDMEFTESSETLIDRIRAASAVPWDVLMLGSGSKEVSALEYPFIEKVHRATCAHAYIVRQHYYTTLLDNFQNAILTLTKELYYHIAQSVAKGNAPTKLHYCSAIDQTWSQLQARDTFYLFNPQLSLQKVGWYSDNDCSPEHQAREMYSNTS
jgi:GR25 family glycosyltransferase involved in LPS biosynthesis